MSLRIAFFQRDLPPDKHGGVAKQAHLLANALTEMGEQVTVFSLSPKPEDARYAVKQLELPVWASRGRFAKRFLLGWFFSRTDLSGYDIVHAHGDNYLMFGSTPQVRTFYGSALAEALHARRPGRFVSQLVFWIGELAGTVAAKGRAAISPGTRKYLPRIQRVIPCGVNLERYAPGGLKHPHPAILFVGDLASRKRGDSMLRLFSQVRARLPEAELWMVGSDGCKDAGVQCFGNLPEEELVLLYQRAWILCHPSSYEGFGVPLVESMACGTPVIAAGSDGTRFVIGDPASGILAQPSGMAEHIMRLLEDKTLRETWKAKGLRRAQAFDIRVVARLYLEWYHELVSAK